MAVLLLFVATRSGGGEPPPISPGSLAEWQQQLTVTTGAQHEALARRFAAVRRQLIRDAQGPQVLRLQITKEDFAAACAAEEARAGALGVHLWQSSAQQVIAAVPPASRRRLADAGIASEVIFDSVAEWHRARRAGVSEAQRVTPDYESAAAARAYEPVVVVFDLSRAAAAGDVSRWALDHENVLGRNASYLAYLDMVPAGRTQVMRRRRYTDRALPVAGIFPLAEFAAAAARFFPEIDWSRRAAGASGAGAAFDGAFHTYEEVESELRDLATRFPSIAKLVSLGPTYEGRELWALKVSRDVDRDDPDRPDVLFTGCHHAREWISVEPPVYFAHRLTEGYATDSAIRALVDGAEIWLVPIVNPDGLTYSQSAPNDGPITDSVRFWRKNRQPIDVAGCGAGVGVDLNRNYPFMFRLPEDRPCPAYADDVGARDDPQEFETYRGPAAGSELEVQHLAALTGDPTRRFVARVDFHNSSQAVLYPWGFTTDRSPEHQTQATLARLLAQQLTVTNWVPYFPGGGAVALYISTGSSDDYAFAVDGTVGASTWELRPSRPAGTLPSFPCEVPSNCFFVPENQIEPINRETWAAAQRLVEWSIDPACSPASAKAYAYVADPESNRVTVIDTETARIDPAHAIHSTVAIAGAPAAIAVTPDGAFAYVVRTDANAVSIIDTAKAVASPDMAVVDTIAVGRGPAAIAIRPDGAFAYVANRLSGDVTVIDVAGRTVAATIPAGEQPVAIAAAPDGVFIYVVNFASQELARIDTATDQVSKRVALGGGSPAGVTVIPDGIVYVARQAGIALSSYAPSLRSAFPPLPVAEAPGSLASPPDGSFLYVTHPGSSTVSIVHTLTNSVNATVSVGSESGRIAFTPDGAFAYIVNGADGTVSILDTATKRVAAAVAVGGQPTDVAIELMPIGCQVLPTPPPRPTVTGALAASPTATPTIPATATRSATPAATATVSATRTVTASATATRTPSRTATASPTREAFPTSVATRTPTMATPLRSDESGCSVGPPRETGAEISLGLVPLLWRRRRRRRWTADECAVEAGGAFRQPPDFRLHLE